MCVCVCVEVDVGSLDEHATREGRHRDPLFISALRSYVVVFFAVTTHKIFVLELFDTARGRGGERWARGNARSYFVLLMSAAYKTSS